jgi:hypothetical protein
MVHSIPTEKGALYARDYLVVEVAISPSKQPVAISSGAFTLRVNGKKTVLSTESAGFVAASLKYADWEQRHPVITGTAQVGDGTVIVGHPPNPGRFPGDPTQDRRMPEPRHPEDPDAGKPVKDPLDIDKLVKLATLPEVETIETVRGCLYFRFEGKSNSIRSLDLEYADGSSLRLLGEKKGVGESRSQGVREWGAGTSGTSPDVGRGGA